MMVPRPHNPAQPPSRDDTLTDYRGRCLLALSLVNHRAGDRGLSAVDVEAVRLALTGGWQ